MAIKKIPYKKLFLPLAEQIVAMKNDFPDFIADWDKNVVTWTGDLQPTPLSKKYTVRIFYSFLQLLDSLDSCRSHYNLFIYNYLKI
ncbi:MULTISPECIES: hypothetical protein [unclassified Lysinibacillus]|uniref:hypothetical protein n=1 Tax=unclassified Lysinibacillus TaxID=2636778 RepID=UPI0038140D48